MLAGRLGERRCHEQDGVIVQLVVIACILKPIFHWNEIYTKKMKCTWPMPEVCVGTQRHLYSTDWHQGLASGLTQILGSASGVWRRVTQKICVS